MSYPNPRVKVEAKKEIVACDEALANEAAAAAQAIRLDMKLLQLLKQSD